MFPVNAQRAATLFCLFPTQSQFFVPNLPLSFSNLKKRSAGGSTHCEQVPHVTGQASGIPLNEQRRVALRPTHSQVFFNVVPSSAVNFNFKAESTQDEVGDATGEDVGDATGEEVGDAVGDVVGEDVGDTVGAGVVPPIMMSNVIVGPAALMFEIVMSVFTIVPYWYAFVFG